MIESTVDALVPGTLVLSNSGWCDHAVVAASDTRPLDAGPLEPSSYLGMYGMPGHTAWAALRKVAPLEAGQTVLVTAGAGAVGVVALQLARASGCRVVASVGSEKNGRQLQETLGVDAIVNYRHGDLDAQVSAAAPDGVDVFLDNTGGPMFNAGFGAMARWGRIVVCGSMADLDRSGAAALSLRPLCHEIEASDDLERHRERLRAVPGRVPGGDPSALRGRADP